MTSLTVEQLAEKYLDEHFMSAAPIDRGELLRHFARWADARLGESTPQLNPDGVCGPTGGNEKPLSAIAAMAVDLGDPTLSSTFRKRRALPREPSEAALTAFWRVYSGDEASTADALRAAYAIDGVRAPNEHTEQAAAILRDEVRKNCARIEELVLSYIAVDLWPMVDGVPAVDAGEGPREDAPPAGPWRAESLSVKVDWWGVFEWDDDKHYPFCGKRIQAEAVRDALNRVGVRAVDAGEGKTNG